MTSYYNHQQVEKKWQQKWRESAIYQPEDNSPKDKKYILDMFPYPSGAGLHVGHPESYTATDIMARYYRFQGYNVLHPMGFDSFGLPAENYAIKTGVHPRQTTDEAIANFRRQIQALGFSYDWSREVNTSSPEYYKWTQWLFLKLYKKGLAYKKNAPVNWCESCKTVLANEQVVDGQCERCNNQVMQKNLEQWFFKVTEYAEELLNKIDELDWSEALKSTQKNWIGKSEGALIKFQVATNKEQTNSKSQDSKIQIEVFTTRPDTLFGATYLVLAPEHEVINNLKSIINNQKEVEDYIQKAKTKNQMERTDLNKDKTGVELKGLKAINPATKEEIPIFIADYVLTGYGTGAIMAVPAHDERDFEFAKKFDLEIKQVVNHSSDEQCYSGEGQLINSDKFDGLNSDEAKDKIIEFVGGQKKVQYKIRDWLISRQRYWGAPIPIIYCRQCWENSKKQETRNKQISNSNIQDAKVTVIDGMEYLMIAVPEKDLPVLLPEDVDFKPTGESPLKSSKSFHDIKCPKCGGSARRESDTMDTFVCSSWYFLRYTDANNASEAFGKDKVNYWLPIDLYIGGMEHAVGHLIYSRFITKALRDIGYLNFDEPFLKMRNQGIILAEDGRKMSKRWGNVINPDDVVEQYGADTLRMYEMFMGPLEDMKPWDSKGIIGVRRFLEKVYKFVNRESGIGNRESGIVNHESRITNHELISNDKNELEKLLHKTIKKVTEDIEEIKFNTAIAAMMEFVNQMTKIGSQVSESQIKQFLIILSPFAPHLTEELYEKIGGAKDSIFLESWPAYDKKVIIDDEVNIAVQINGKVREVIKMAKGASESEIKATVLELPKIKKYLEQGEVKKIIFVPDKLVNLVISS